MFLKIFTIVVLVLTARSAFAQQPGLPTDRAGEWVRIQSDDGEFSVDLPPKTVFFYNKDGYYTAGWSTGSSYLMREMYLANAYFQDTLMTIESYRVKESALGDYYAGETDSIKKDEDLRKDFKESVINRPGYSIRQTIRKINGATVYRQYVAGKHRIYFLTSASRNGETQAMRHFLESVRLNIQKKPTPEPNVITFSNAPKIDPVIETRLEKDGDKKAISGENEKQETAALPFAISDPDRTEIGPTILMQPKAPYIDSARIKGVKGSIKFRLTLSDNGNISKIIVLKTLPGGQGLLRQALFAALRIKFLPPEKNSIPESADITREYSFDIY